MLSLERWTPWKRREPSFQRRSGSSSHCTTASICGATSASLISMAEEKFGFDLVGIAHIGFTGVFSWRPAR